MYYDRTGSLPMPGRPSVTAAVCLVALLVAWPSACASFPEYDLDPSADGSIEAGGPSRDGAASVDALAPPVTAQCAPPIGPVDTSGAKTLVGTGTAASCTEAALRAALAEPADRAVIGFDCGLEPIVIPITQTLVLRTDRSLVIEGNKRVTLDGGDAVRILSWSSGGYRANAQSLVLQGLTFARGRSSGTQLPDGGTETDGSGGAVYFVDGALRIHDCTFQDNVAPVFGPHVGGGAVFASSSKSVQITSSTFYRNRGANGGAVFTSQTDLGVYDTLFRENVATGTGGQSDAGGAGGGLFSEGGSEGDMRYCGLRMTANQAYVGGGLFRAFYNDPAPKSVLEYSEFRDNQAGSGGGTGAYILHTDTTVSAVSFVDNHSLDGVAALALFNGTIDLVNTTIARNRGVFAGLSLTGNTGTIRNCTIAQNHATAFNAAINGATNGVSLTNSIVSGNESDNAQPTNPLSCGGGVNNTPSSVSAMTGGAGCVQFPGTEYDPLCAPGVQIADPQLGELDDTGVPVLVPAAASPARTAATTFCPATDARGAARPATGCTAGAVQ